MSDSMAEIKASFFIECEELMENLQDGLQTLEAQGSDDETINIIFRAVHSIKGGAGAFGLDDLVSFAHRYETALDELRAHRLQLDESLLALMFQCSDALADLVRECRDALPHDDSRLGPIYAQLDALIGAEEAEEEVEFSPMTLSLELPDVGASDAPAGFDLPDLSLPDMGAPDLDLPELNLPDIAGPTPDLATASQSGPSAFKIHFAPSKAAYATGHEPLVLFRNLKELGDLTVKCNDEQLPPLSDLDPHDSLLSWELDLTTDEPIETVRDVFEFVEELCELSIEPVDVVASDLPPLTAPQESAAEAPSQPVADISAPQSNAEPAAPTAAVAPPPEPAAPAAPKPAAPAAPPAESKAKSAPQQPTMPRSTVRVDLDRIDRLVNLVGELVINQAMIAQSVEQAGLTGDSSIRSGLDEFLLLTRNIQDSVMLIRAQKIKSLFQRMGRIVREASADVGKNVRLKTEGENTEVDKTLIERLADPLTHMIRNAVDHGLEDAETRQSKGKSPEGTVEIRAAHRSGRVIIEVSDDGAGINRPKVLQIAQSKGLVPESAMLSDAEIDNLLFLPGFSTSTEISNLSGRGVGMDVVRSSIQELGGRISISSVPNEGTSFSISLPLTLAVLDGMVVQVAGETIVVPLSAIVETQTLHSDDIRALGPTTNVVRVRDKFVPMLDLAAELGFRGPLDDYAGNVMLLVLTEDGSRAALVADRIQDQRQVVIKGLKDNYGRIPGIAAATILGDGQIALILDAEDIVSQATGRTRNTSEQTRNVG